MLQRTRRQARAAVWPNDGGAESDTPAATTNINGRVVDRLGRPRPNVAIRSGSLTATTSGDGTFVIPTLPTYDIELVYATSATTSGKQAMVFRGLTTRTPTLQVDATDPRNTHASVTVGIQGPAGAPVSGSERVIAVFAPAANVAAESIGRLINGGLSVGGNVTWAGDSPNTGTLYGLRYTLDAGGHFATQISGHGSVAYELVSGGAPLNLSLTMNGASQTTNNLSGTIDPAGGTVDTLFLAYRVGGRGVMSFFDFGFTAKTFDLLMPQLTGYSAAVMTVVKTISNAEARVWKVNLTPGTTGIELVVPTDFTALNPVPDAAGIDFDTPFTGKTRSGARTPCV
jgi:hypothetical protein